MLIKEEIGIDDPREMPKVKALSEPQTEWIYKNRYTVKMPLYLS